MTASATENHGPFQARVTISNALRETRDLAGWQNFHALYRSMLLSVCIRAGLAEQDAHDVVWETIIEVAKAMPTFRYDRTHGRFKSWLLAIVFRRIANFRRAKHHRRNGEQIPGEKLAEPDSLHLQEMAGDDFDRMWDQEWRRHAIRVAEQYVKNVVEPVQFEAFLLHVEKGVGARETARRLGIKLMEVYWAKYRVGRLMRNAIGEAERF